MIKVPKIKATVIGVIVRHKESIEYHLSYWNGKEHINVWLYSFEIEEYVDNSKPAGFGHKPMDHPLLD